MRVALRTIPRLLRSASAISGRIDKPYFAGVLFFLAVVLFFVSGGVDIYHRLSNSKLMPMTSILISGERHYVSDTDLQRALKQVPQAGNFFTLDVNKVQKALEALPWVKHVSVRKQWPNKLRVYLQEQQPEAVWNNKELLNPEGQIFKAPVSDVHKPLVHLNGPDDFADEILNAWKNMQKLVGAKHLSIQSVTLNARRSWSLTLTNGIQLRLGQRDRIKRLQRFISLYDQLHPEKMAYADLRYNNGLAVGWKHQQD
ncbi:cell division protein FtsQ/DivIB [Celerinatantimonas diazotrophica]|uniref:Cell division protein FtsQ n=1 Tax=Celerinatantimonas diazotrophica TaxID=412034 RepID=A0A4R1K1T2_9GAMM|nr:cell division protein FtsQ/DivIB [Celerinatantimonas diazotrophica]TCK57966.1 cell division protein FtsQ [Celerinatantimonas diazotrophica]CAG9297965.1 Cell division protein FtsQ [Celerinatantimonas diazotrophica]